MAVLRLPLSCLVSCTKQAEPAWPLDGRPAGWLCTWNPTSVSAQCRVILFPVLLQAGVKAAVLPVRGH